MIVIPFLHQKVANNEANEAYGGLLGVVMGEKMHTMAYQLSVDMNTGGCT